MPLAHYGFPICSIRYAQTCLNQKIEIRTRQLYWPSGDITFERWWHFVQYKAIVKITFCCSFFEFDCFSQRKRPEGVFTRFDCRISWLAKNSVVLQSKISISTMKCVLGFNKNDSLSLCLTKHLQKTKKLKDMTANLYFGQLTDHELMDLWDISDFGWSELLSNPFAGLICMQMSFCISFFVYLHKIFLNVPPFVCYEFTMTTFA